MYNIAIMPRRSKDEAERTRARILASALTLFVKNGYDRTTFTDIAERLKMTKGAVYWHFESKQALLIALVDEMLAAFERHTQELLPRNELTVEAMASMMVREACEMMATPKFKDYFLLMHTQIRWGDATMDGVREDLLKNQRFGPWHAFVRAVENDLRAGRVRSDADPEEVACLFMSLWDGTVQAAINGFISKEKVAGMLTHGFEAIRRSIERPLAR